MSKKDYQAIAAELFIIGELAELSGEGMEVWRETVEALARIFAAGNPRFDRARFIEACETGKYKGMRAVDYDARTEG
jgi:hypothetical protein